MPIRYNPKPKEGVSKFVSCVFLYLGVISLGYGKVRYGTFILESGVFWCWLLFFILLFLAYFLVWDVSLIRVFIVPEFC